MEQDKHLQSEKKHTAKHAINGGKVRNNLPEKSTRRKKLYRNQCLLLTVHKSIASTPSQRSEKAGLGLVELENSIKSYIYYQNS